MRIEVRLCNILAQCRRGGADFALTLPNNATLGDALRRISLRHGRLAAVLCNGQSMMAEQGHINDSHRLQEGDHLVISAFDPSAVTTRRFLPWAALGHLCRRVSALLSPLMHTR